jgi:hypothetical protein
MKTLVIYIHLISACIAVGVLLMQDLALAKTRGKALSTQSIDELKRVTTIISVSLCALWFSGFVLVLMGYLENPQQYLLNQKLWGKFAVVTILTLNGYVLHRFSFPRVVSPRGICGLEQFEKTLVVVTGCTSTVSWLFSCYLGIARPWNFTVSFGFVMSVYLALLALACTLGCLAIHFFNNDKRLGFTRRDEQQMFSESISLSEPVSKT